MYNGVSSSFDSVDDCLDLGPFILEWLKRRYVFEAVRKERMSLRMVVGKEPVLGSLFSWLRVFLTPRVME